MSNIIQNRTQYCNVCGVLYQSRSLRQSIFCSNKCKQKQHKLKRKNKRCSDILECVKQKASDHTELKQIDLINLFNKQDMRCFFCKCILECDKYEDNKQYYYKNNYNKITLDRIDNSKINHKKNYNINNVNMTCLLCNIMRGNSHINYFQKIINILLGITDILDLKDEKIINRLSDKQFGYSNGTRIRNFTPLDIKKWKCDISDFPLFLGSEKQHPLLPSGDRINNNNKSHEGNNLHFVCKFINLARNDMELEFFKEIFNEKFPKRIKEIKILFPDNYDYNVGNKIITLKSNISNTTLLVKNLPDNMTSKEYKKKINKKINEMNSDEKKVYDSLYSKESRQRKKEGTTKQIYLINWEKLCKGAFINSGSQLLTNIEIKRDTKINYICKCGKECSKQCFSIVNGVGPYCSPKCRGFYKYADKKYIV
jgi:hypothetical protein